MYFVLTVLRRLNNYMCFYPAAKPGYCPAVDMHHVGICKSECSSDRDCQGERKCCSNGCGRVCSAPAREGTPPQCKVFHLFEDNDFIRDGCSDTR